MDDTPTPRASSPAVLGSSTERAPNGVVLTHFRVRQEMLSLKAQVDLNVLSNTSSTSVDRFKITYEAVMETGAEVIRIDRAVWEKVYAVGVLLELDVLRFDSKVKTDIFSVAAAVELGMCKASFTTTVFPADSAVLQELVPKNGDFNIEAYDKILEGIGKAKEALATLPDLRPQVVHRPSTLVFNAADELAEAAGVCFAAVNLVQNNSYNEAMQEAAKRSLDPAVVHEAYRHFWNDMAEDKKPPKSVRDAAGKWLGW